MELRLSDIAFAEALARVEAHLELAVAINAAGDPSQALVHASRPMIELMPRLSRELWGSPEIATEINRAVGAIAAGIRTGAKSAHLQEAAAKVRTAADRAIAVVVGDGRVDGSFVTSVVVALLRTAAQANRGRSAVPEEGFRYGRADAVAYAARARHLCAALWKDGSFPEGLDEAFALLQRQLTSETPQDAEAIDATVASIADLLHASAGALLMQEPVLIDYLKGIGQLLAEAEKAYSVGDPFRADKLAAAAYVENYALVRDELAAVDPVANRDLETVLTEVRLRMRAEASVEEVSLLVARGRSALASLQRVT